MSVRVLVYDFHVFVYVVFPICLCDVQMFVNVSCHAFLCTFVMRSCMMFICVCDSHALFYDLHMIFE